jgi:hypothetical protein
MLIQDCIHLSQKPNPVIPLKLHVQYINHVLTFAFE